MWKKESVRRKPLTCCTLTVTPATICRLKQTYFALPSMESWRNSPMPLFSDFKWCSEYKLYLSEICSLLSVPYTVPQICSGTRWLSCYDRALETINLIDPYLIFYFAFLIESYRDLCRPMMMEVLEHYDVEVLQIKKLFEIMMLLSQKKGSWEGKQRK